MAVNKTISVIFFLLPFQFSLGSIGESDIPLIRLFIPVVIMAWVLRGLVSKEIILPKPKVLFGLTAFILWAIASLTWAENPEWAMKKAIFWLTFFPLFLVLNSVFHDDSKRKSALAGLVYGAFAVGIIGIAQFLAQFFFSLENVRDLSFWFLPFFTGPNFSQVLMEYPSIFVNIQGVTFLRAFGFFPDPHIFAFFTGMMIPLAIWFVQQKESTTFWQKSIVPVLFMATLFSFSRASYVALIVSALLFFLISIQKVKNNISVIALLIFLSFLPILFYGPLSDRLWSSFSQTDSSVSERSRLWHEAVVNISKEPLSGVGLGNYPLLVKPTASAREPIYVHNLYLDIAVEIGLIGLTLFLFFVISCIPFKKALFDRNNSYIRALFFSLSIFLIHSLFEYPLFSLHILPLFLIILALLYVEKR